jgi:hypothetical protein
MLQDLEILGGGRLVQDLAADHGHGKRTRRIGQSGDQPRTEGGLGGRILPVRSRKPSVSSMR